MKMQIKTGIALGLTAVAVTAGARELRVLAIGNSFSQSLMKELPAVAAAMPDCKLNFANMMIGGCPLERHWDNVEKAATDPSFKPYSISKSYAFDVEKGKSLPRKANIPEMLVADRWDIVTIQQASPKSPFYDTYQPYADKLIAKIRELAPQAEIVVQETWSYCTADKRIFQDGGPGSWGFDQKGMYDRLSSAYADLAKKNGFRRIPTGTAVQNYRAAVDVTDPHNDVVGNFWKDKDGKDKIDSIHLNPSGEYLQALTWLDTLFGVDARNVRYAPKGLDPKRAETIRKAAAEASKKYRRAAR